MAESRWLRWIGPGGVALGAVALIASTTLGAGTRPWGPRACAGPLGDAIAAARQPATLSRLRHPGYVIATLASATSALASVRRGFFEHLIQSSLF